MKNIRLLFLVLVVVSILTSCKKGKPNVAEEETDFKVSAVEFFFEYNTNELKADDQYKEKIIEVSGTVEMVYDDKQTESARVTLFTGDEFGSVECIFELEQKPKALALNEGDLVVIKGYCEGMVTNAILNYCLLLDNKGNDPEFLKNLMEAEAITDSIIAASEDSLNDEDIAEEPEVKEN